VIICQYCSRCKRLEATISPRRLFGWLTSILRHTAVPVQPVCLEGSRYDPLAFSQWRQDHASLLKTYWYKNSDDVQVSFKTKVIACAEAKAKALLAVRLQ
jgi:hypothetical protein